MAESTDEQSNRVNHGDSEGDRDQAKVRGVMDGAERGERVGEMERDRERRNGNE